MRLRFGADAGGVMLLVGVIGVVGLTGVLGIVVFGEAGPGLYVVLEFLLRVTREIVEEASETFRNAFRTIWC